MPNKFEFPTAQVTSNQNKEQRSPKQPISMKRGSKFVGHLTEIIRQSKIKGPLIIKWKKPIQLSSYETTGWSVYEVK